MRVVGFAIMALILISCNGGRGEYGAGDVSRGVAVCGSSSIKGKAIARVRSSTNRQCGFGNAVELYSVAGVEIRGNPQVRCSTAKALEEWTRKSAVPAVKRASGETLERMDIWVGYACRSRSSSSKLSEHALGNAVDIASFRTDAGNTFSVKNDWRRGDFGRAMVQMKKGACGPFGVVLHPDNEPRFHSDHFHFDTSNNSRRYRYCSRNP